MEQFVFFILGVLSVLFVIGVVSMFGIRRQVKQLSAVVSDLQRGIDAVHGRIDIDITAVSRELELEVAQLVRRLEKLDGDVYREISNSFDENRNEINHLRNQIESSTVIDGVYTDLGVMNEELHKELDSRLDKLENKLTKQ